MAPLPEMTNSPPDNDHVQSPVMPLSAATEKAGVTVKNSVAANSRANHFLVLFTAIPSVSKNQAVVFSHPQYSTPFLFFQAE